MKAKLEHNVKRVRKSVRKTHSYVNMRTRKMARKIGSEMRDNIRGKITPRPHGVFPGYAMSKPTAKLAKKVVAQGPKKVGKGWQVIVRVLLTGKTARYAAIHEVGGRIPIRNPAQIRAMFASLRKYGQLGKRRPGRGGRLTHIRIRRKEYFAKGVKKTRKRWTRGTLERWLRLDKA